MNRLPPILEKRRKTSERFACDSKSKQLSEKSLMWSIVKGTSKVQVENISKQFKCPVMQTAVNVCHKISLTVLLKQIYQLLKNSDTQMSRF